MEKSPKFQFFIHPVQICLYQLFLDYTPTDLEFEHDREKHIVTIRKPAPTYPGNSVLISIHKRTSNSNCDLYLLFIQLFLIRFSFFIHLFFGLLFIPYCIGLFDVKKILPLLFLLFGCIVNEPMFRYCSCYFFEINFLKRHSKVGVSVLWGF
jgi:hypothetical protein